MVNILILEDDKEFATRCATFLISANYNVFYADSLEKAKGILIINQIDIALVDMMLPPRYGFEGIDFLKYLKMNYPHIEPFMMTSKGESMTEIVAEAMQLGAQYFFDKTSDGFEEKVLLGIKTLLNKKRQNIFISHGSNELLKLKLKDFLINRLGRNVVILSEQASQGLTIVEKLERTSEKCVFAIILMTKDDEQKPGRFRSQQNVIHEIGFFQGKYGRKKVVLLAERGVELFTNISGIVSIEFDAGSFETVFESLRIEIEEAFRG